MRIRDWSSDVCSSDLLEQAQAALEAGDSETASAIFAQVLQHDAENTQALAGLVACHLASGDVEGAREIFDGLDDKLRNDPAFASVAAQLALQEQGADAGEIPLLMEKVAANQSEHPARFDQTGRASGRERVRQYG